MKLTKQLIAILLVFALVFAPLLPQKAAAAEETREGYKTLDEAVEYIRKELAAFRTGIRVKFQFDSPYAYSEGEMWDFLKAMIIQHTGVPDEGDYLNWTFQTVGYDFTDEYDGTTHYVTVEDITPQYNNTAEQEQALEAKLEQVMAELALDGKTDYEKIEAIYRYVCENVDYSVEVLSSSADPLMPPEELQIYYTAYGALVLNSTTCQGFSSLIYRMMLMAGIDCRLIAGDNHGWNIVKLDGKYYYLDATWDETVGDKAYDPQYFLSGSASFRIDGHKAWNDYYTPDFIEQYPVSALDYGVEEPAADQVLGSGKCGDNVRWKLTGDGKLTISGSGKMWNAAPSGIGWAEGDYSARWKGLNGYIKSVEVQKGVTSVGDYAFYNCPQLSEITFASTVKHLGSMSFALCEGLTELTLPDTIKTAGEQTFYQCPRLETVTLSAGMKEIPMQMFVGCSGLKTVYIPEGIETIGDSAFHTCPKLQQVNIPSSVTALKPGCFASSFDPEAKVSFTVPETVKEVGWASFENTGLREVIWNARTEKVESAMFNLSCYLENVEFCDSATSFAEWTFHDCNNLKTVKLPGNLKTVGDDTFWSCLMLKAVTLPATLTNISRNMFGSCISLEEITIPDNVTSIDVNGFSGCSSLKQIIIPASVEKVGIYAFATNSDLTAAFMGDAPETTGVEGEEDIWFHTRGEELEVVIYYPEGNETWTGNKKDAAAGRYATWKPMHSPDAAHTPGIMVSDAESHWQTCTGCLELLNLEAHSYSAACDEVCDVCSAFREMTHTYGEWVTNEKNHWHECVQCGKQADTTTHVFGQSVKENGMLTNTCTDCGYAKSVPLETEPEGTQPEQSAGENNGGQSDLTVIIVVAVVVIVGGVSLTLILKKRKKADI